MCYGGAHEQVLVEVTSTDSCSVSLNRLILFVLKPLPENGTQKKMTFQMKESGIQAGSTPDENDRALAVVSDELSIMGIERRREGGRIK